MVGKFSRNWVAIASEGFVIWFVWYDACSWKPERDLNWCSRKSLAKGRSFRTRQVAADPAR